MESNANYILRQLNMPNMVVPHSPLEHTAAFYSPQKNNFLEKWTPTFHLQFVEYVLRTFSTYFEENWDFQRICGKLSLFTLT